MVQCSFSLKLKCTKSNIISLKVVTMVTVREFDSPCQEVDLLKSLVIEITVHHHKSGPGGEKIRLTC